MTLSGHTSMVVAPRRYGRPPSSWLQLPVSQELEISEIVRKLGLWAGVVDVIEDFSSE